MFSLIEIYENGLTIWRKYHSIQRNWKWFMENHWTLIDVLILKIIFLNEREYQLFFRNQRDRIIRNKGEKGRGNIFSEKLNQSRIALDRL